MTAMDGLWALLNSQPILTLFLVICLGYALGEVAVAGFSLLGTGAITLVLMAGLNIAPPIGAGLFTGALVNTAALDAVVTRAGSDLPVVGYGVAYPFGVFGPILWIYLLIQALKPQLSQAKRRSVQGTEVLVTQASVVGQPLSALTSRLPPEVQVVAVRQNGHNYLPRGSLRLNSGDELLLEGEGVALSQACQLVGPETAVRSIVDVRDLEDVTVYVSRSEVIGRRLGELNLAETLNCVVISVLRGDSDHYPHPGLVLEAGDQLHLAAAAGHGDAVQAYFGNSARSITEVSYLALGLGMVLGVLFGLIPFPLPGLGSFSFGAAGGAMVVSLLLGWRKRLGPLNWVMPPSANLTLRNFGLTLFLAVAGLRSAATFFITVQDTGLLLFGAGMAITITTVLLATLLSLTLFRLRFDQMVGVVAGVTGNPAILAYASKTVPTNQPELGYAMVFPTSTIIKIVVAQGILALAGR
jgi:putative transport protein